MTARLVEKLFVFTEQDIAEGKYSAWDLVQPLWYTVSIYDGLEVYEKDLAQFTEAQRKFLAMFWYDSEVCNGGHDQFFSNSTGIVWKDALEGMRMIGAAKCADNFQKAVDMFGGAIPFDRGERNDMLENKVYKIDSFDGFEEIDTFYYDKENLSGLMYEYARSNAAEFVVNGKFPCYEYEL